MIESIYIWCGYLISLLLALSLGVFIGYYFAKKETSEEKQDE